MVPTSLPPFGRSFKRAIFSHLGFLLVIPAGVSPVAGVVFLLSYVIKTFGVTAGYHRYFSHRAFKTSRWFQFVLGLLGALSGQRGPLWWAARHRHHHRHSDTDEDVHSPIARPFWWAHLGWLMDDTYLPTEEKEIPDLLQYPELRWIDRHYAWLALLQVLGLGALGHHLQATHPGMGTSALQLVAWGFFASTLAQGHTTMLVNSMGHLVGTQPYETRDSSRNNAFLALISLGDGWHNNHHKYPYAARHGILWWEIDVIYLTLRLLAAVGLVRELKQPRVDAGGSAEEPTDRGDAGQ